MQNAAVQRPIDLAHLELERPASPQAELDQALRALAGRKDAWAAAGPAERVALIGRVVAGLNQVEAEWVQAAMAAKGISPGTMAEGEEWYSLTVLYRGLRFLRRALLDVADQGRPRIPGGLTRRQDGRVVARVVPSDWKERLALPGFRAEVWLEPSSELTTDGVPQAAFYRQPTPAGRMCLVLGAGNVAALGPADCFHKLFVEGQVVALKMHPVHAFLGPILERALAALIEAGYLRILYGGPQAGQYLCEHPLVDTIHMTGSVRTYESIIFGSGAEGQDRKAQRQPQQLKPVSAELGSISPVIVVPGPWSDREIRDQAARIGSWLVPNAGFNCATPRLILQWQGWNLRQLLIDQIAAFLRLVDTRPAYYPGSIEQHRDFLEAHPEALQLGDPGDGQLAWTLIPGLDANDPDEICFRQEPFLGLFSETALAADSVVDFIQRAVAFCNQRLWGSLVASIVVHPKSMRDRAVAAAVEAAIADLRYGSVVINQWGAVAHYMGLTPWGGYPGSQPHDIQSGVGFVNNPLMFDQPQKSVIYTDFSPLADPFLADTTNNHLWLRQDTRFQERPTVLNLARLLWRALTLRRRPSPFHP